VVAVTAQAFAEQIEICRQAGMERSMSRSRSSRRCCSRGAGTFGFLSLAAAARRFEVVADTDSPERAALADHLGAAIKVSIAIVQQELAAMTAAAT
jgi:threonine dehydrogenase-like Zn-dependent dehydrogenase